MASIGTYGFINAKVRTMRSFLLSESVYRAMGAAKNLQEFFAILSQTQFKGLVERMKHKEPSEIEEVILLDEIQRIRVIEKNSRGSFRALVSLFLERYEGERLKTLLRYWHRKENGEPLLFHEKIVYDIPVGAIISARNLEEVVALLEGTPFQKVLSKKVASYAENKTVFSLELAIDRDLFNRFWKLTESLSRKDRQIARRLLGTEIDLRNVDWIGRFRKYYTLPSAEMANLLLLHGYLIRAEEIRFLTSGGNVSEVLRKLKIGPRIDVQEISGEEFYLDVLERFLYQILMYEANRAFGEFPFSIGSVLGYCILVRIQTKNLRTLLQSKVYGLGAEQSEALLIL